MQDVVHQYINNQMSCGGMQVCADAESDASSSAHTTDRDGETSRDDAQSLRSCTNM